MPTPMKYYRCIDKACGRGSAKLFSVPTEPMKCLCGAPIEEVTAERFALVDPAKGKIQYNGAASFKGSIAYGDGQVEEREFRNGDRLLSKSIIKILETP